MKVFIELDLDVVDGETCEETDWTFNELKIDVLGNLPGEYSTTNARYTVNEAHVSVMA